MWRGGTFLGRAAVSTHSHTLAFQMATPLMRDCPAQGGFWGTRRPGHSQGPPAPNSLFPRGPQARAACLRQKGHREDKGLCLRGRSGQPCSLWPDASAGAFVKAVPLPASEGPGHTVPAPSRVTLAESSALAAGGAGSVQDTHPCPGRRPTPAQAPTVHPGRSTVSPRASQPWEALCLDAAGHERVTCPRVWGALPPALLTCAACR